MRIISPTVLGSFSIIFPNRLAQREAVDPATSSSLWQTLISSRRTRSLLLCNIHRFFFWAPKTTFHLPFPTALGYITFYNFVSLPFPVWFQQPFHYMLVDCTQRRAFRRTFFADAGILPSEKNLFAAFPI